MFLKETNKDSKIITEFNVNFTFLLGSVVGGLKDTFFQGTLERELSLSEEENDHQGNKVTDIEGKNFEYKLTSSSSAKKYIDFHPGDISNLKIDGNPREYEIKWSLDGEEANKNFKINSTSGWIEMLNPMEPGVPMTCSLVGTLTSTTSSYSETILFWIRKINILKLHPSKFGGCFFL